MVMTSDLGVNNMTGCREGNIGNYTGGEGVEGQRFVGFLSVA